MTRRTGVTRRIQRACALTVGAMGSVAGAQLTIPGADGFDGTLTITANTTIDLAQAVAGAWDTPAAGRPGGDAGKGLYDATKWAIVFKYTNVTINSGATLKFSNHPSGAPVVWLVSGNVTIGGTLSVDGGPSVPAPGAPQPGPGGFPGGRGYLSALVRGSAGFGPGGGRYNPDSSVSGAGSFSTVGGGTSGPTYGNCQAMPLVGGSGGSPKFDGTGFCGGFWYNPGAGGGAILIATRQSLQLDGSITANGGSTGSAGGNCGCGGSAGMIRLVANSISGNGQLRAIPQTGSSVGGKGRIRIETNLDSHTDPGDPHQGDPGYCFGLPANPVQLWPDSSVPTVKIVTVAGQAPPAEPLARPDFGTQDILVRGTVNPTLVVLNATNVPASGVVQVRVIRKNGADFTVDAALQGGQTWIATVNLPQDMTFLQGLIRVP